MTELSAAAPTPSPTPESLGWRPERPRLRPVRLVVAWMLNALVLLLAVWIAPGASLDGFWGAVAVAAVVAVLNAVLPPLVAALRLPFTLALGFVLVLVLDAVILLFASDLDLGLTVNGFWAALLLAVVVAAVGMLVQVVLGANDADPHAFALAYRVARRQGAIAGTDVPGIVFLEIDGLGPADPPAGVARWQRARHGRLARRGHPPTHRMGDRPVLADRREPGGHPAGLQRGHPRVPVGGEGDRAAGDVLRAGRLRRDRAAPHHGARTAPGRGHESRQPAVG